MYAFIGLAISMYFSSQGAAKVIGPVLAQTARLLFIAAGGWWLSTHDATAQDFFALAAASMVVLGVLSCAERGPDALGTEARRRPQGAAGAVLTAAISYPVFTRLMCTSAAAVIRHAASAAGSCSSSRRRRMPPIMPMMSPPPMP